MRRHGASREYSDYHGVNMRAYIVIAACLMPLFAEAQIFKCTEPDGSLTISYVPCKTETGVSEYVEVKTNEVGTFATQEQIEKLHSDKVDASQERTRVSVVVDSSTEDQSTLNGIINKRLRLKEEALERQRGPNTSGVAVVYDRSGESQLEKAYRLKQEAAALAKPDQSASNDDHALAYDMPEINTREVPYVAGQDPLKRQIKQVENKVNNPQSADFSRVTCRPTRPDRGAVKFRGKEIWPGMQGAEVRRLIGSPENVVSLIVGNEQWSYSKRDGGTLFVRLSGLCVASIQ